MTGTWGPGPRRWWTSVSPDVSPPCEATFPQGGDMSPEAMFPIYHPSRQRTTCPSQPETSREEGPRLKSCVHTEHRRSCPGNFPFLIKVNAQAT